MTSYKSRDALFDAVQLGRLEPNAAEAIAAEAGWKPLAPQPRSDDFDPFDECRWTLAMCIVWLCTGDEHEVRSVWPRWNAARSAFVKVQWKDEARQHNRGNYNGYRLCFGLRDWSPLEEATFFEGEDESAFTGRESYARLLTALKTGELSAEGGKSNTWKVIPASDWTFISTLNEGEKDKFVFKNEKQSYEFEGDVVLSRAAFLTWAESARATDQPINAAGKTRSPDAIRRDDLLQSCQAIGEEAYDRMPASKRWSALMVAMAERGHNPPPSESTMKKILQGTRWLRARKPDA